MSTLRANELKKLNDTNWVGTAPTQVPTNDVIREQGFAQSVDSVSTLRTSTFPASLERLWLSGYYGVGTAGGGPLYRDSDDTTTADNSGTVFVDADGVRWKMEEVSGQSVASLRRFAAAGYLGETEKVNLSDKEPNFVIGVVGDKLYGHADSGGSLYESGDLGETWTFLQSLSLGVMGSGSSIHLMDDGEVLINTGTELYKSSGWESDPKTATFSQVLVVTDPNTDSFHQGWGLSVRDNYVMATEYGQPKPTAFRSYLSTDSGSTFTEVFDLRDEINGWTNNAHNHGCCVDPYHNYRLWQITGDSGNRGLHYSDDDGATWAQIPLENYPSSGGVTEEPTQYTIAFATPEGIVLGSDGRPDGIAMIPRDDTYESGPRVVHTFWIQTGQVGLTHIANGMQWLDGVVYTSFALESDQLPTLVTATQPVTGETWIVWDDGPLGHERPPNPGDGDRNITHLLHAQNHLLICTNEFAIIRADRNKAWSPRSNAAGTEDSGHVLLGRANPDQTACAVGITSHAEGLGSTAVGGLTKAAGSRAVAVGLDADADGTESVALGNEASAPGSRAVTIGWQAAGVGDGSVSIGRNSSASGSSAMAFGENASAEGSSTVSIGRGAQANGNFGIAIGRDASAPLSTSIAIGREIVATSTNQLKLGNVHIEIGEQSTPAAPDSGLVRFSLRESGGTQQLIATFANGTTKVVADDT